MAWTNLRYNPHRDPTKNDWPKNLQPLWMSLWMILNNLVNKQRTLRHTIDQFFHPTNGADNAACKESISTNKLQKQDAALQDTKRALGWDYAVCSKSILVAPHRKDKVTHSLNKTLSQHCLGLTKWQSLLGQLCSLLPIITGGKGQLSILQATLCNKHKGQVWISPLSAHGSSPSKTY
jgi:hypothetical protein